MTPEEKKVREDLAALYRLLDQMELGHRIYSHHSARVPGDPAHMLLSPFGVLLEEVNASTFMKINRDGDSVDPPGVESNKAASILHWAAYNARDDVMCVAHYHSAATVAVGALETGLLPMSQGAMQFYNRIGYHDYEGPTFNPDEQPRLAADLGPHRVLLLRNHGALVCGRSVAETYVLIDDLEKACKSQLLAMSSGAELKLPSHEVCEQTALHFEASMPQPRGETRDFPAALRELDRLGIEYKH